jgi:hypothetical protein
LKDTFVARVLPFDSSNSEHMTKAGGYCGVALAPSKESASIHGWNDVNKRLHSVLAHPFGLPLSLLFDYLEKFDNESIKEWDESNLGDLKELVYLDADHLNLLQAVKDAASAHVDIVR